MSTDCAISAGTLASFRFNGKADLKHMNIRKEHHGEEIDLAIKPENAGLADAI